MKNILNEKPSKELHGRCCFASRFVKNADIKKKKILDIGCGYGWFELNALSRGCRKIVGVELTEKDLKTAKTHILHKNADFKLGSAAELPFESQSFDTVTSWEVLEHVPGEKEKEMFREAARVLKKNGVFYLSTPFDSLISKTLDPAWWLIGHRHYSSQKIAELAEQHGFEVEKIVLKGGVWEIVGANNMYMAKWIFKRKPFLEHAMHRLQDKEYERKNGFTNLFAKLRRV
jgi:SAM-dependent methyltransferase